jgi:hypothetical protein
MYLTHYSRFLRARQFDFKASKVMLSNCEAWRASVGEGRGMEQLYKDIDPFDVSVTRHHFDLHI